MSKSKEANTPEDDPLQDATCRAYDIANLAEMLREDSLNVGIEEEGYKPFSNVQRTSMANAIESLAMGLVEALPEQQSGN